MSWWQIALMSIGIGAWPVGVALCVIAHRRHRPDRTMSRAWGDVPRVNALFHTGGITE